MNKIIQVFVSLLMCLVFVAPPVMATAIPATGVPSNTSITNAQIQQYYEDTLAVQKEMPGGTSRGAITIATDAFVLANNVAFVVVSSQTGTTDDLKNVTQAAARDGRLLYMTAATGHTITIKHANGGSGQFLMADSTDLVMQSTQVHIFVYNAASTRWEEVYRDETPITLGALAKTGLTLDTNGYATPTRSAHTLDTFASAASDNCDRLVTLNKIPYLIVRQANAARVVTLRHNIGGDGTLINRNGDDITFTSTNQAVLYERVGTTYEEIARFGFPESRYTTTGTIKWGDSVFLASPATNTMPAANTGVVGQRIRITNSTAGTHATVGGTVSSIPVNAGSIFEYTNTGAGYSGVPISYGYPLLTTYGGTGANLSGTTTGAIVYKDTSSTMGGLAPANNTFVAYNGSGFPVTISQDWTASAEQTIATSSTVSIAHSLGRNPYDFRVVLRCKTTEAGYAVGDEVLVHLTDGTANRGFCAGYNNTNCFASISSNAIMITPKAGGANVTITPANWRIVMYYR